MMARYAAPAMAAAPWPPNRRCSAARRSAFREIARLLGIASPVMRATVAGEDYVTTGRTLARLGLEGINPQGLASRSQHG